MGNRILKEYKTFEEAKYSLLGYLENEKIEISEFSVFQTDLKWYLKIFYFN